jgi:hypothetical protein
MLAQSGLLFLTDDIYGVLRNVIYTSRRKMRCLLCDRVICGMHVRLYTQLNSEFTTNRRWQTVYLLNLELFRRVFMRASLLTV